MPRPRKGVTPANLLNVDRYFAQALKDNRLFKSPQDFSLFYDAKQQFAKLPAIDWQNETTKKLSMNKRTLALQAWIDKYISPEKWQRCLLTLRQNKSRKKLKLRRLDLKLDVYLTVKVLAKKQGRSIGETIFHLAKPALDKIYKSEFAKELAVDAAKTKKRSRKIKKAPF